MTRHEVVGDILSFFTALTGLPRSSASDLAPTWVLTVTGKRNKRREVPLADEVVALLDTHARDVFGAIDGVALRGSRQGASALPLAGSAPGDMAVPQVQTSLDFVDPAERPLIFALGASVAQWRLKDGEVRAVSAVEGGGGALSGTGIYAVLKRFFTRAAESAEAAGLERERFEAASTHWLRHTFVRQALVDGAPIEVLIRLVTSCSRWTIQRVANYVRQRVSSGSGFNESMRQRRGPSHRGSPELARPPGLCLTRTSHNWSLLIMAVKQISS